MDVSERKSASEISRMTRAAARFARTNNIEEFEMIWFPIFLGLAYECVGLLRLARDGAATPEPYLNAARMTLSMLRDFHDVFAPYLPALRLNGRLRMIYKLLPSVSDLENLERLLNGNLSDRTSAIDLLSGLQTLSRHFLDIQAASVLEYPAVFGREMDSSNKNFRWEEYFHFVTQNGWDTGNNELQDYTPNNVRPSADGSLALVLERAGDRWASGKIKSKAPIPRNGGSLTIEFTPPDYAQGLWPAIWLLPNAAWPTLGEIDLFEAMHRTPDLASLGISTLHFGPRPGQDYVDYHTWGLRLGKFLCEPGKRYVLEFTWTKRDGQWHMRMTVNGAVIWCKSIAHQGPDVLDVPVPHLGKWTKEDLKPDGAGDPVRILREAFDTGAMHLIVNLAFGGNPFCEHGNPERAEFTIHRLQISSE